MNIGEVNDDMAEFDDELGRFMCIETWHLGVVLDDME